MDDLAEAKDRLPLPALLHRLGLGEHAKKSALCPFHDDPELGADPLRNNDFLFEAEDPAGLKTPSGSHMRRCNPRDAAIAGVARIHRMIRRGTAYGPALVE